MGSSGLGGVRDRWMTTLQGRREAGFAQSDRHGDRTRSGATCRAARELWARRAERADELPSPAVEVRQSAHSQAGVRHQLDSDEAESAPRQESNRQAASDSACAVAHMPR